MLFEDVNTALRPGRRRRACGFTMWVGTLSPEERDLAERLVADRTYNCRELAKYFHTKGAGFNDQVLNRHRNGRCCRLVK